MFKESKHYRRHFCGMGPSVAELVMIDTVDAHPSQTNPSAITTKPGANTPYGSLKEIDAGVLNVDQPTSSRRSGRNVAMFSVNGYPIDNRWRPSPNQPQEPNCQITRVSASPSPRNSRPRRLKSGDEMNINLSGSANPTNILVRGPSRGGDVRVSRNGLPLPRLRRVVERMEADLNAQLDLQTLAIEGGYSRNHFLRMFREATGYTPHQYLLNLRVKRTQTLMKNKSMRLIDVALASGFSSHAHLSRVFKRVIGETPSEYRRSLSPIDFSLSSSEIPGSTPTIR